VYTSWACEEGGLTCEVRSDYIWPWQLQLEAQTELSAMMGLHVIFGHCNIHSVWLSTCSVVLHQKVTPPSTPCSIQASGNEFSWLVVVINLSQSALYATSTVRRLPIKYFFSSRFNEGDSSSRDRCRRHACTHRGCDRPSWASSAWVSCCRPRIRSHRFWDGKSRSSLQCVRSAQCARYARCGLQ
jgi:hypothetical protein